MSTEGALADWRPARRTKLSRNAFCSCVALEQLQNSRVICGCPTALDMARPSSQWAFVCILMRMTNRIVMASAVLIRQLQLLGRCEDREYRRIVTDGHVSSRLRCGELSPYGADGAAVSHTLRFTFAAGESPKFA
jgi:hypothetical protein